MTITSIRLLNFVFILDSYQLLNLENKIKSNRFSKTTFVLIIDINPNHQLILIYYVILEIYG